MDLQNLVEIAAKSGKLSKEEVADLREELADLKTAEQLATKASDLIRDGNLFIPSGEPGRDAALKWWEAAQAWRGWR